MEIELENGDARAIIDPLGAWVTNLSDQSGDILFPKRLLVALDGNKKARGGCHVCLPQFGPGGESGLEQHGFGRTSVWEIEKRSLDMVILTLRVKEGNYTGLTAALTYQLSEHQFTMKLTVHGSAGMKISPGFHPYFSVLRGEEDVEISGERFELSELSNTEFRVAQEQTIELGNRTVRIWSKELPTWAIWSDQLGSYICIEPTLGGNMFQEGKALILRDDTEYSFAVGICW
ncbi:MAG TPA: hypothetical protein VJ841_04570 [Candidatus Saccharimonadales bacterium]|nr:hypothetical protein [Candidatus Saccharimonadales bacterium]